MLSRAEKARSMLALAPRGGGVLLRDFHPGGFGQSLLQKMNAMGIPGPVLHGGALRDAYMKAVYGDDVSSDDYDVRSGLLDIPAYRDGGPQGLLRLFLASGFTLNPDIDPRKANPEILQAEGPDGKTQTLVTLRLLHEGRKVDYIGATNFRFTPQQMASTASESFSSIAMGADGDVYADENFAVDAQHAVTRLYDNVPEHVRYATEEHIPKLSRRYHHEIKIYQLGEPLPRDWRAIDNPRPAM